MGFFRILWGAESVITKVLGEMTKDDESWFVFVVILLSKPSDFITERRELIMLLSSEDVSSG